MRRNSSTETLALYSGPDNSTNGTTKNKVLDRVPPEIWLEIYNHALVLHHPIRVKRKSVVGRKGHYIIKGETVTEEG